MCSRVIKVAVIVRYVCPQDTKNPSAGSRCLRCLRVALEPKRRVMAAAAQSAFGGMFGQHAAAVGDVAVVTPNVKTAFEFASKGVPVEVFARKDNERERRATGKRVHDNVRFIQARASGYPGHETGLLEHLNMYLTLSLELPRYRHHHITQGVTGELLNFGVKTVDDHMAAKAQNIARLQVSMFVACV